MYTKTNLHEHRLVAIFKQFVSHSLALNLSLRETDMFNDFVTIIFNKQPINDTTYITNRANYFPSANGIVQSVNV